MTPDEIGGTTAVSPVYPGLYDPLTDTVILVCALLTIWATWRAWKRRIPIGAVPTTPWQGQGAVSEGGPGDRDRDRGPVRFRKIRRVQDARKWAGAMLWRGLLLTFFVGSILAAGISGSLLAWWYLGGS